MTSHGYRSYIDQLLIDQVVTGYLIHFREGTRFLSEKAPDLIQRRYPTYFRKGTGFILGKLKKQIKTRTEYCLSNALPVTEWVSDKWPTDYGMSKHFGELVPFLGTSFNFAFFLMGSNSKRKEFAAV